MTNRIPDYLKLHVEEPPEAPPEQPLPELERLQTWFPAATGLQLSFEIPPPDQMTFPWSSGDQQVPRISLAPSPSPQPSNPESRRELEAALGQLCQGLFQAREELRRREAELATAVPVVSVEEDGEHLAERLQSVLRATADMLGASRAALYLLDEGTTKLKLRAEYGLGSEAFLAPPRLLEEAIADIEAMAGHAVVLDRCQPESHWNVPESCESAICIPVASATTILGTLWVFRDTQRNFTPTEQNLAEITAGRLAADLERAVLVQEVRSLRRRTPSSGECENRAPLPARPAKVAPLLDGWEIGDDQSSTERPRCFSHWHVAPSDLLHLSVGALNDTSATQLPALQSFHAAHTQHDLSLRELATHLNESLWTSSVGGAGASLFHGILDPTSGGLEYFLAGGVFGFVLRPHGWEPLLASSTMIGSDLDWAPQVKRQALMPGDVLVVMNGVHEDRAFEQDRVMNQVAEKLLRNTHLPSTELAAAATRALAKKFSTEPTEDFTVIVAKRNEMTP